MSNCCDAPIIENTDLCSKCYEHCVDEFDQAMSLNGKDIIINGVKK